MEYGIIHEMETTETPRAWLRSWQKKQLPDLRNRSFPPSRYRDAVTLVIYAFLSNEEDFIGMEFSILQSWKVLGLLPVKIIADREYATARELRRKFPEFVEIQTEPTLIPGRIETMSQDMIIRLHGRFSTPYCLIIQDDGFPLNDTLNDFLGKWDYIGAPSVRDVPAQYLADLFRLAVIGGGFSLRSKRICKAVSREWAFWKHFIAPKSKAAIEDIFYTQTACLNPFYRFRFRFPSSKQARKFDVFDFNGIDDIRDLKTFGVHGPTAIRQRFS